MPYVKERVIIGEIKQICTMAGASAPSEYWQDLDGTVVSDPASPFNGKRIYNLNGANVVLSLDWTADVGGAYCTVAEADINALNVGDGVTGTGITNVDGQPPVVISIDTGTRRVTIGDAAASGVIADSTFTNDGIYLGGGSDGSIGDAMQGHKHNMKKTTTGTSHSHTGTAADNVASYSTGGGGALASHEWPAALGARTDGTNGTQRTSTRTRPHTRFVKMIMRIK